MNQVLDKQLCEKYPKIFADRYKPMTETAMCWGFECGDGWFNIINILCSNIQSHIDWLRGQKANTLRYNRALKRALEHGDRSWLTYYYTKGRDDVSDWMIKRIEEDVNAGRYRVVKEPPAQVVASQVKEKYGTLRFYYNGGDDYIRGLESMAESISACTCEKCGNQGRIRGRGWLYTACDQHTKPGELENEGTD